MRCEVIVSTYENPRALHLCLVALYAQHQEDFNICIADDGSGLETKEVVEQWQRRLGASSLRHVWQSHKGFGKNKILNRAIAQSNADYLIFIDGDCVSSSRFIHRHKSLAQPGRFLTGGVIRLSESASLCLHEANITSGEAFNQNWLSSVGALSRLRDRIKLGQLPEPLTHFMEIITPVNRTWNGGNASGWRQDLLTINGFDESLNYGAEDVELGYRLNNIGIKGRHLRYSAPLLHLEHSRSYVDPAEFAKNRARVSELRNLSLKWTNDGILKGPA